MQVHKQSDINVRWSEDNGIPATRYSSVSRRRAREPRAVRVVRARHAHAAQGVRGAAERRPRAAPYVLRPGSGPAVLIWKHC